LRVGINYGNFILATRDAATGESRGVAIDLARELAGRLGVGVQIVAYDSVAVMVEAAPTNTWDIAFLGSDPAREKLIGTLELENHEGRFFNPSHRIPGRAENSRIVTPSSH